MFGLILAFWRGDGRLPDEPEAPGETQDQTPEIIRSEEQGQTIVEYAVLLTWLTLFFIGFIGAVGGGTKGIWSTTNANLSHANTIATGH